MPVSVVPSWREIVTPSLGVFGKTIAPSHLGTGQCGETWGGPVGWGCRVGLGSRQISFRQVKHLKTGSLRTPEAHTVP